MSFVQGTHFYRQKTKYTKPAPNPVPTTNDIGLKINSATGVTPVAGLIFETKNRAIFSGELFSGEEFLEKHYCPYNFVPINVCGVDSFSPN